MAGEWVEKSLGDLIDIKHGFAFRGEFFHDEPTGDILLTPGNFAIGGGFKADKFKYYDGPVPDEFVLHTGDLIVTMTDLSKNADTLGYPALVPSSKGGCRYLHNQRLGKVVAKDKDAVEFRYLHYLMCGQEYRHEVVASATGTTVKHTSPERIKRFRFRLPPPPEQRAIAHILGTLDDKIELNRRMNETLEAIAHAIFKSWFLDATEDDLPEGWRVISMPDAVEVNPPRSLQKGEVAPYVDMQNMPTRGHRPIGWLDREFGSGMRFINGDTLLARITPCLENGKTAFVDWLADGQVGWGSTEYIVLRPKPPLPPEYAYYLARSEELRTHAIQNMTGSSGRQRVPSECFAQFEVAVPPDPIARRFGKIAQQLMNLIRANDEQSRTLAALRDTLLPKLISGELRLKDGIGVEE